MKIPSVIFTTLLSLLCLCMVYQFLSLVEFKLPLKCSEEPCLNSFLNGNPNLRLSLYTTFSPFASIINILDQIRNFDYRKEFQKNYNITLPRETRYNGTLWMFLMVGEEDFSAEGAPFNAQTSSAMLKLPLGEYAIPGLETCKSLGAEDDDRQESLDGDKKELKPVTHLYKNIYVTLLTEEFSVNQEDIPFELQKLVKINYHNEILPILESDFFKIRYSDLVEVNENMTTFELTFHYSPIGLERQQFMLLVREVAIIAADKGPHLDEIKEYVSSISFVKFCLAIALSIVVINLYILTLRNDIFFWGMTKSYAGLSMRTTLLRCFGMIIIFLHLRDEDASLISIILASFATAMELWKCKKILKIEFTFCGIRRRKDEQSYKVTKAEKETQVYDKEAMRYLSYILIPLFLGGTSYYLIYPPFRSWYSWTLASLASGLYKFGWIFMLPQVFINYKMKSVAALPWRAFIYKALTIFIDDVIAFFASGKIPFGTNCFREDIILIIFLYQRWIYPLDKSPLDSSLSTDDETDVDSDIHEEVREKKDN